MLPQASRAFRDLYEGCESTAVPEAVPFLKDSSQQQSLDLDPSDLEGGISDPSGAKGPRACLESLSCSDSDDETSNSFDSLSASSHLPRWQWRKRIRKLYWVLIGTKTNTATRGEKLSRRPRRRAASLRRVVRIFAFLLMLLGLLHFLALACGLWLAFFPDEVPWPEDLSSSGHFPEELGRWPTDITADIGPVACASHNDYWRKEPLFSALHAGCTGVEADVWAYKDDLFVGHSTSSLVPTRTLRSLYIDPLLKILDQTNPITDFHPSLKVPRNGVFDTNPRQTLVLLIDFKNNGEEIWPYVQSQLQPLRDCHYLTYWNGTDVVEGPVTVVVTGNAPFHRVVENELYRDMFYDAPLDLMSKVPPNTSPLHRISDKQDVTTFADVGFQGGQGHSGSAPTDPMVYSPANSYYASVSFKRTILHFPTLPPWRSQLTSAQMDEIRKQIAGAHARGLKVRYWSVPEWPRGLRNYFWRVLVKEGVDFLNVDDLKAATSQTWVGKQGWSGKERGWWFTWT